MKAPKLTSNLDDLINTVKKAEQASIESKKHFSDEAFRELWANYHSNIESKTVNIALKTILFEIAETTIKVIVPNERIRDLFVQEKDFSDLLNDTFKEEHILLNTTIDLERFPALIEAMKTVKPMTAQEKYVEMVKKNPKLEQFRKDFDLKLDTN